MTESTQTRATLELSPRDVQCVTVMIELCATLLSTFADPRDVQHNYAAMECLYDDHYSDDEWDSLRQRARALLPLDGVITFEDPRFRASSSTVLS